MTVDANSPAPDGAVTYNVLDAQGNVVATYEGTNDTGATDAVPDVAWRRDRRLFGWRRTADLEPPLCPRSERLLPGVRRAGQYVLRTGQHGLRAHRPADRLPLGRPRQCRTRVAQAAETLLDTRSAADPSAGGYCLSVASNGTTGTLQWTIRAEHAGRQHPTLGGKWYQ